MTRIIARPTPFFVVFSIIIFLIFQSFHDQRKKARDCGASFLHFSVFVGPLSSDDHVCRAIQRNPNSKLNYSNFYFILKKKRTWSILNEQRIRIGKVRFSVFYWSWSRAALSSLAAPDRRLIKKFMSSWVCSLQRGPNWGWLWVLDSLLWAGQNEFGQMEQKTLTRRPQTSQWCQGLSHFP